ncbi:MAG: hypothetical protein IKE55_02905 [Kiritimatiellae bacterium]|nr:hypothetical protein [Kiritimatiellia bacterium]
MKNTRKGSAILIVLGMLSFMVVSAVGFSIYMRSSRTPSSYLRRNVAARYLVRSALAKAIEELEGDFNTNEDWGKVDESETDVPRKFYGIYDDPYPGIVLDSSARSTTDGRSNGDYWAGRVFMPFGSVSSSDATVPTLTLEALAYLPPAIVDDVRRLSRRTRTASWRSFPYDSGRYAYCAVNVSDMFDINRLRANVPRNSGSDRITLASLCANSYGDPTTLNAGFASQLDALLDEVENKGKLYGNVVPFTSIADFNVVAGSGSDYAPFMDYIGTGSSGPLNAKQGSSQTGNAIFITDTWFPPTNIVGETVFDLGSNAQPFNNYNARSFLETLLALNSTDGVDQLYQKNLGIGVACLYDYLDSDSKPVSLALPTVEAVPMIVGVGHPVGISPELGEIGTPLENEVPRIVGTAANEDGEIVNVDNIVAKRICRKFGITSFGNRVMVPVVAAFPFKRMKTESRTKSYTVRGLLRVWLAPDGMGCRPGVPLYLYPERERWEQQNGSALNGVATFVSAEQPLSAFNVDVNSTEDAVAEVTLTFSNLDVQMPIYYKVEESTPTAPEGYRPPVKADDSNLKSEYLSFGDFRGDSTVLRPLRLDGEIDPAWQALVAAAQLNRYDRYPAGVTEFTPSSLATEYRLYAAVWVQVLDGSDVVDMAPACVSDDNQWLTAGLPENNAINMKLGDGAPLLNFKSDGVVKYEDIETSIRVPPVFTAWKALYAVDPRYNFAPEDWFSSTASDTATKSEWVQLLGLGGGSSTVMGQQGRDRDIFMFVSDQEYLQSIGELQFLPRLDMMDGDASFLTGDYVPNFHGESFLQRTGPTTGNFANGGRFWKTYSAYGVDNDDGNDESELRDINPYSLSYNGKRVTVLSGANGFKLNPFSDDDRVITAALIGTPFDYYVASTNENQKQSGGRKNNLIGSMTLSQMMSTYSFGNSSLARITNNELYDIAGAIKYEFRRAAEKGDADWLSCWDMLMWQEPEANFINDMNTTFMEDKNGVVTLGSPLHGVDRKFLYSFWRECFDNRQQLFLIFVRAEPASVGGGSLSRTSSQLGARAVALVWRDPTPPSLNASGRRKRTEINGMDDLLSARDEYPPHRTRVLFYHQFD